MLPPPHFHNSSNKGKGITYYNVLSWQESNRKRNIVGVASAHSMDRDCMYERAKRTTERINHIKFMRAKDWLLSPFAFDGRGGEALSYFLDRVKNGMEVVRIMKRDAFSFCRVDVFISLRTSFLCLFAAKFLFSPSKTIERFEITEKQ